MRTSSDQRQQAPYWARYTDGNGTWRPHLADGPPGAELAALRRGIDKEPGSVPSMWPFYTTLTEDGRLSDELRAEHLTLTLFAVHHQGARHPLDRRSIGVGAAMLALRRSGKFSEDAVDRRFAAAATASSLGEVGHHLRCLITQLRSIGQGLSYTHLFRDLIAWQSPERQGSIRRHWGAQYFAWRPAESEPTTTAPLSSESPELPHHKEQS